MCVSALGEVRVMTTLLPALFLFFSLSLFLFRSLFLTICTYYYTKMAFYFKDWGEEILLAIDIFKNSQCRIINTIESVTSEHCTMKQSGKNGREKFKSGKLHFVKGQGGNMLLALWTYALRLLT